MITITVENFNTFSQRFYDSVIVQVQIHQLTCKCGHSACLTIHGYYQRYIQTQDGKVKIKVTRVKCSECGKTHALLISSLVPYSQIPLVPLTFLIRRCLKHYSKQFMQIRNTFNRLYVIPT